MHKLTPMYLTRHPIALPHGESDKNDRGRVLAVASSQSVPGAALLVAGAALRAGAGKVQIAAPRSVGLGLGLAMPEVGIVSLAEAVGGDPVSRVSVALKQAVKEADAVVVGPGHKDERFSSRLAVNLLAIETKATFLIDAVALSGLWRHRARVRACKHTVIITPHIGEMARMLGIKPAAIEKEPVGIATQVAKDLRCIVALKGAVTYVVSAQGESWRHTGGSVGLATSGSGDVLAGITAGLVARGVGALQSILSAVLYHAKAGRQLSRTIGRVGFLASELLPLIPRNLEKS